MLDTPLPNVRKLFLADPGYVMFEADLKGADAQVVAWEAEDDDLKSAFRAGIDIHSHNAEAMWGPTFTNLEEHSYARRHKRQECKHTVHGINYGCSPRTTAIQRGWTVKEAERFHTRWLSLHPGIRRWHERIQRDLARNRTITNAFGFRRVFFDRLGSCFTEALAWVPQSTVAINTYHGAFQLEAHYWPDQCGETYVTSLSGILLQTHDSLNFQFQTHKLPPAQEIKATLLVKTPYPDPLFIPWDLKSSTKSWGDVA
jgi:hypothetical protein